MMRGFRLVADIVVYPAGWEQGDELHPSAFKIRAIPLLALIFIHVPPLS